MSRSLADLIASRAPALLRLGVMLTGNRADAEDLLQTTLLHAHLHGEVVDLADPGALDRA